jgi:hypothetical protein
MTGFGARGDGGVEWFRVRAVSEIQQNHMCGAPDRLIADHGATDAELARQAEVFGSELARWREAAKSEVARWLSDPGAPSHELHQGGVGYLRSEGIRPGNRRGMRSFTNASPVRISKE